MGSGSIVSGLSTFFHPNAGLSQLGNIYVPKSHLPAGQSAPKMRIDTPANQVAAQVTGQKKALVVRVSDKSSRKPTDEPAQMSDKVFGTDGDPINLKSQLSNCSAEKLTITNDQDGSGYSPSFEMKAPGVIEVSIDVDLQTAANDSVVENAITTAVQTFTSMTLPGAFDYVLYVIEGCYHNDCGWAGYAYIGSWLSVYVNNYYGMPDVTVHELGHNFGFAHSGMGTQVYADHTCMVCLLNYIVKLYRKNDFFHLTSIFE